MREALTGRARLAGIMGFPVEHSLSPRLHGHWLRRYGVDGAYVPLAVAPERLEQALRALPALGFRGCNLTLPHKEEALRHVDRASARARRIGAINTVVVAGDGTLEGHATDGFGFLESIRDGAPGYSFDRGAAVVVGAGGAARSVIAALQEAGTPEIRLLNRTAARGRALAADLGGRIEPLPWEERAEALTGATLLLNTTSLGMAGQPPLDLPLDALPGDALVTDAVYVPLETPLLAAARRRGNPALDGLGMLLHQARPGFEAWYGTAPEVDQELRRFVLEGLG